MTLTLLDAVAQSTASAERKVLGDKKLFTLVYVGDSEPRPASDDEAEALGKVLAGELVLPPVRACSKENPAMPAGQSRAEPSIIQHMVRPAGPCMHCGVPESPQWRKGPPTKPVLCNACGTRYRRTSQLGSTHRPALCPARSGSGQARKRCADQDAEDRNTQGVKSARQYVM